MTGWIRKKRIFAASALLLSMFLYGCTSLLNGDLTVAYLTEEERAELESQGDIRAVINYRESVFNPQAYDSEYPDAFYIPENYSKEARDIRGFELLDFVNGDTFIYAYQTMEYSDKVTVSSSAPVSADYVFYENSMTQNTRELSGKMVTVLAANRYTAQTPGAGYRELQSWVTDATENQSFFADAVGGWEEGSGSRTARIGSYAIYFNEHAVVYRAAEVQDALKKENSFPLPLISYNFSGVVREIMTDEKIGGQDGSEYQFDINDVSFAAGEDYVDVYMSLTQSDQTQEDDLSEDEERVERIPYVSGDTVEEEEVDESRYSMKSYEIHLGFYELDQEFTFTVYNCNCDRQVEDFRKNGTDMPADHEWNVSDNSIVFRSRQDVLRRIRSSYSEYFLQEDVSANAFVTSEETVPDTLYPYTNFKIDGFHITGRLRMTGQIYKEAVRQGYYMDGSRRVESDMNASFIYSRSFILEKPMIIAYSWNSQGDQDGRQYSRHLVMNGILVEYAAYLPEEDADAPLELMDVRWPGGNYWNSQWHQFTQWYFVSGRYCRYSIDRLPAVSSVTGKVSLDTAYILCYTQEGIYLYGIGADGARLNDEFVYLDYSSLNASEGLRQNQDAGSNMNSILQEYGESEIYREGVSTGSLSVSAQSALQREYNVDNAAPDVYPDYSINRIFIWIRNQFWIPFWTVCTASHGLEIIQDSGTLYIPVFQKNVIYAYEEGAENTSASYYQQLTRLEEGVAAYAVFENQGEDKAAYPYLLLGYDYQGAVYTAMDIARAKVIPFAILEPDRIAGTAADEAWKRLSANPGEYLVFYLKDCYDRNLYGTVSIVPGYQDE